MAFLRIAKDGGKKSTVTGFWLIELKNLFSVALLRFGEGSRDEYHSHAFDSISWLFRGELEEQFPDHKERNTYKPSLRPIITRRWTFHRVVSRNTSWVLTFRGPWSKTWYEYNPADRVITKLGHGREVLAKL